MTMSRDHDQDEVTCHKIVWTSLNKVIIMSCMSFSTFRLQDTVPRDCWPVGGDHGHWYGGGETLASTWPLDSGHIAMSPFVTGDGDQSMWGNVIRKYFLNSGGVSISVSDNTPLSVSLNSDPDQPSLCLQVSHHHIDQNQRQYLIPGKLQRVPLLLPQQSAACPQLHSVHWS